MRNPLRNREEVVIHKDDVWKKDPETNKHHPVIVQMLIGTKSDETS